MKKERRGGGTLLGVKLSPFITPFVSTNVSVKKVCVEEQFVIGNQFLQNVSIEGKQNKLGNLSAQVADLTEKMRPFLSQFHRKAHSWWCQVLSIKLLFLNSF